VINMKVKFCENLKTHFCVLLHFVAGVREHLCKFVAYLHYL